MPQPPSLKLWGRYNAGQCDSTSELWQVLVRRGWWLWAQCPGLGVVRLRQLQQLAAASEVDLEVLWHWPLPKLSAALAWPQGVLLAVDRHRRSCAARQTLAIPDQVILPMDDAWPEGFRRLERPPLMTFWQGDQALLPLLSAGQAVAVVGSRRASRHALQAAELLGRALAMAGWPVVSGLAEGVDASAHKGCLAVGGQPVAVLGTPLNRAYPAEHLNLQARVAQQGLLLSELSPGTRVQRSSFARRNRLLVAIARHVVVVECPEGSGALLTAEAAVRQGRSLSVMPADALRPAARGSNRLLREGAQPLLDPESWVAGLGMGPLATPSRVSTTPENNGVSARANPLEHHDPALLALLDDGASLPQLAHALQRSSVALAEDLVQLELEGVVVAEPGMRWRLA